ncbi:MAG: protein-glutamate O-methyltransferase CheR [Planctomycetes bacterium]|nr:protein-glutamate O-methyltransferase CheR [Planctomycetota bacterium]
MTNTLTRDLSDADFAFVKRFIAERAGIRLSDEKRAMVQGRLGRRVRELGLASIHDYLERVREGDASELVEFTNALTTNLTSFFREAHHFAGLAKLVQEHRAMRRPRLRVWSSACSTGQEPYSIALTLQRELGDAPWDTKVLATDLDSKVLEVARRGEYAAAEIDNVPADLRGGFEAGSDRGRRRIGVGARQLITFRQLNLLESWPMKGPFDAIFCRNVLIYFANDTQRQLVERFVRYVRPGGYLFLGHSESLCGDHPELESLGRTIFRRRER